MGGEPHALGGTLRGRAAEGPRPRGAVWAVTEATGSGGRRCQRPVWDPLAFVLSRSLEAPLPFDPCRGSYRTGAHASSGRAS